MSGQLSTGRLYEAMRAARGAVEFWPDDMYKFAEAVEKELAASTPSPRMMVTTYGEAPHEECPDCRGAGCTPFPAPEAK